MRICVGGGRCSVHFQIDVWLTVDEEMRDVFELGFDVGMSAFEEVEHCGGGGTASIGLGGARSLG